MKVSKWGNSLALELKEGDDVEITLAGSRAFQVDEVRRREKALAGLKQSNWTLPPAFKFDREQVNERS
jgi:antitoxin MazE